MAQLKTQANDASVDAFPAKVPDKDRQRDAFTVLRLMEQESSSKARMWGVSIVGFGEVHLRYDSGRELDWFKIGFSPRREHLVLYGLGGFEGSEEMLARLGKYKRGKGCLYIKRLEEVDLAALGELIRRSALGG